MALKQQGAVASPSQEMMGEDWSGEYQAAAWAAWQLVSWWMLAELQTLVHSPWSTEQSMVRVLGESEGSPGI